MAIASWMWICGLVPCPVGLLQRREGGRSLFIGLTADDYVFPSSVVLKRPDRHAFDLAPPSLRDQGPKVIGRRVLTPSCVQVGARSSVCLAAKVSVAVASSRCRLEALRKCSSASRACVCFSSSDATWSKAACSCASALQEKVDALALLTAARAERRQVDQQLRELKTSAERLAVQNQLVEDLRNQAQQAGQQYEALQLRAAALEQRNSELELLLAAANAAAQSQADLVKGVLERINPAGGPGKAKRKVTTG